MTESTTAISHASSQGPAINNTLLPPLWARLLLPSVGSFFFAIYFWLLTFGFWGPRLLGDVDIGWHIRNGEHILSTRAVPHTDYLSYTMFGRPWYAWEWLYDVIIAEIHKYLGLNGVVILSALVIALTFALLFHFACKKSGNVLISAALTIIAGGAASVHFFARPHVFSWLFTLVWFVSLDDFTKTGKSSRLAWLPALMLVWVNVHGGFLLGIVLTLIFAAASLWTALFASSPERRNEQMAIAQRLGLTTLAALAVTVINPYGLRLHLHVREFLGDRFMMDHIQEYVSPDFHGTQVKLFLALILLSIVGLSLSAKRMRAIDFVIVSFATYAGLYAVRNIPISAILLTLVSAPLLTSALTWTEANEDFSFASRRIASAIINVSNRTLRTQQQLKSHIMPVLLVAATLVVSANHSLSRRFLDLKFNSEKFPVKATEFLASHGVHDKVLTQDGWSGLLIYELYPNIRLFIDDRFDLYGDSFMREYFKAVQLQKGWDQVLDKNNVNWVVISPDLPLATMLRLSPDWSLAYQDKTALVFARNTPRP